MAQSKSSSSSSGGGRSRSGSTGKSGPPQILLIELKQRILAALNKLADRDTQHIAVEDLERIAEALSPEGISLCLSCLYETNLQQKSAVRKECVKLFGTLALLHDSLLAPHLPKIVNNIVKRLRDPDSSIRDACVDTMGTLAANVFPMAYSSTTVGGGENAASAIFAGPLGVFAKPLFDALSEQDRGVQAGAAMSLARVIDNFKDPAPGALQRFCPRIIKLMNSSSFTAKAALLSVVASIVQAGGATSHQCLASLVTCVVECLRSNDWAARKAASETLEYMASSVGPSLGTFKLSVLETLESCRFDKVKPVRDSVILTLQAWKKVTGSEVVPDRTAVKENTFIENRDCCLLGRKSEGFAETATLLKYAPIVNQTFQSHDASFAFGHVRSAPNKISDSVQKKRTPLIDKKANPDFFQNMEKKDSSDWQIDIAVPRAMTPCLQESDIPKSQVTMPVKERKAFQEHTNFGHTSLHGDVNATERQDVVESVSRWPRELLDSSQQTAGALIENQVFEENVGMSTSKNRQTKLRIAKADSLDPAHQHEGDDGTSWTTGTSLISASSSSTSSGHVVNSGNELTSIRRQLNQIENQQATILELLQKFMRSSEESLSGMEVRMAGVETVVDNLVRDLANGRCDNNTTRQCGKLLAGADFLSSKFRKKTENRVSPQDRSNISSESTLFAGRGLRDSLLRSSDSNIISHDESKFGSALRTPSTETQFLDTQANSWRVHVDVSSDSVQRRMRDETEGNQYISSKKVQERGLGTFRLGEGPSARSIWQPSKEETTLAAIRVAGEDGRMNVPEIMKAPIGSNRSTVELRLKGLSHKIGGQGKGPFWSLWSRATEFLRSRDVDSAYAEVLCAGDELLLVRLMSRTGPVLEQLSSGTAHELLQTVVQLLLQQSFLDVVVPWIQQVADLVTSTGPDCVGLSMDAKREFVASLEEASTFDYPEVWIAKTLDELAIQLATSWGLVQRRGMHESLAI